MQASLSVAVMPAAVVLTVVVAAVNSSGVMDELSGQQRQHGLVGVAADTGVQPDVGPGYGSLRTRADAAADQRVNAAVHQKGRHGAVAAARVSTTSVCKIMPLSMV